MAVELRHQSVSVSVTSQNKKLVRGDRSNLGMCCGCDEIQTPDPRRPLHSHDYNVRWTPSIMAAEYFSQVVLHPDGLGYGLAILPMLLASGPFPSCRNEGRTGAAG